MNDLISKAILCACQNTTVSLCCFDSEQMAEIVKDVKRAISQGKNPIKAAESYIDSNF